MHVGAPSPGHLEVRHAGDKRTSVDESMERGVGRSRYLNQKGTHGPIRGQESEGRHRRIREIPDHHRRVPELELASVSRLP